MWSSVPTLMCTCLTSAVGLGEVAREGMLAPLRPGHLDRLQRSPRAGIGSPVRRRHVAGSTPFPVMPLLQHHKACCPLKQCPLPLIRLSLQARQCSASQPCTQQAHRGGSPTALSVVTKREPSTSIPPQVWGADPGQCREGVPVCRCKYQETPGPGEGRVGLIQVLFPLIMECYGYSC